MSIVDSFFSYILKRGIKGKSNNQKKRYRLSGSVVLGDIAMSGAHIKIGEHTYFNSGYISSAENGKVLIGNWCAIGYNVSIVASTHDVNFPTGPEQLRPSSAANITIGDGVWIGNNVVILPGVSIGNFCVIAANAVVKDNMPDYAVCGGMPAKVLYLKDPANCIAHKKTII